MCAVEKEGRVSVLFRHFINSTRFFGKLVATCFIVDCSWLKQSAVANEITNNECHLSLVVRRG